MWVNAILCSPSISPPILNSTTLPIHSVQLSINQLVQKLLIHRKLTKLTPGLNLFNVLRTAFTCANPRSVKKTVKLSIFFILLGSTSVKAARKTLVKLTPDCHNYHFEVVRNILQKQFHKRNKLKLMALSFSTTDRLVLVTFAFYT